MILKQSKVAFRFPKTRGTPSAVVFEFSNKRKVINKIFQKFGKKSFNFQIWRQNLKMVF